MNLSHNTILKWTLLKLLLNSCVCAFKLMRQECPGHSGRFSKAEIRNSSSEISFYSYTRNRISWVFIEQYSYDN